MARYRKKPVVIEAYRFMIDDTLPDWFMDKIKSKEILLHDDGSTTIKTLEGTMKGNYGDYIIRGVNGEVYACKPDIFEKTYETETVENVVSISSNDIYGKVQGRNNIDSGTD